MKRRETGKKSKIGDEEWGRSVELDRTKRSDSWIDRKKAEPKQLGS